MSRFYCLITEAVEEFNTLAEKYKLNSRLSYEDYNLCVYVNGELKSCPEGCNNQRVLASVRGMITLLKVEHGEI